MADNANVELIRKGYDAFIKGDMETVSIVFADDILFRAPGRHPLAGNHRGKQEVFEFFRQLAERSDGTFTVEVNNIFGADERVVVIAVERAERDGKTLNLLYSHVWQVEGGLAREVQIMPADQYAEDDFWS
jgi:uncharacterized protein